MLARIFRSISACLAVPLVLAALAAPAGAVPTLQLDIIEGEYNFATESVLAPGRRFTLMALATPGSVAVSEILGRTYYLSVAITPKLEPDPAFDAGSFVINGQTIAATDANLAYGAPPSELEARRGLAGHRVYDTYFRDVAFAFNAADRATTYNTQNDAGAVLLDRDPLGGSFFATFEVDASNLRGENVSYGLHFDLFNMRIANNGDVVIDQFAPFSHDAEMPTPETLPIFGAGLAALVLLRRRRNRSTPGPARTC